MEELISIIVPVYKSEAYIANLINDVIAQTYQPWELILVSNGDHREKQDKIIQQYALADKRIHFLTSNKVGPGAARNIGMKMAKGKWLTFVDADDSISPTHLQTYVDAVSDDVDVIIGGYTKCNLNGKVISYPMELHHSSEGSSFYDYYLCSDVCLQGSLWNKFYNTEKLLRSGIFFHEDILRLQDVIFNYELILHGVSIRTIPMTGYTYLCRYDSICGRYAPSFENILNMIDGLKAQICKMAGYSENKINQFLTKKQYINTYISTINLFRPDCPISFGEKVKHLELLLNDKDFIRSRALPNRTEHKMNLRIFDFFVMLGSPLCMSVGYTILFKNRELYLYFKKKLLSIRPI